MSYIYVPQTAINKKNLHQMAEGKDENPINPNNQLSERETLDDKPINPILKTSVEERHYGTIPGSVLATQTALSHSWAQENPTVGRGLNRTKRVKKLSNERAAGKSTQTDNQKKQK